MPSKSAAQKHTMRAAAHNPKFAKKVGIPQGVARDFVGADTTLDDAGIQEGDTAGSSTSTADHAGKTVKTVKPKFKGKSQFALKK